MFFTREKRVAVIYGTNSKLGRKMWLKLPLHLIADQAKLQFARVNGFLRNCVCRNQETFLNDLNMILILSSGDTSLAFIYNILIKMIAKYRDWFVSLANFNGVNKESKILQEGSRPCTIFFFALMHCATITWQKRFYWLAASSSYLLWFARGQG